VAAGTQSATRRELIARGLARRPAGGDAGSLRALTRAEQVLVVTYAQVLAAGALSLPATSRATEFLAHERAHLETISRELKRLGGTLPRSSRPLSTLPTLTSDRAAVRLLLVLERAALHAYWVELGRLRDARASRLAAEIMACGAQHATELRELLSPGDVKRAVPSSFVFGSP
jgi:hypothetical protein